MSILATRLSRVFPCERVFTHVIVVFERVFNTLSCILTHTSQVFPVSLYTPICVFRPSKNTHHLRVNLHLRKHVPQAHRVEVMINRRDLCGRRSST